MPLSLYTVQRRLRPVGISKDRDGDGDGDGDGEVVVREK